MNYMQGGPDGGLAGRMGGPPPPRGGYMPMSAMGHPSPSLPHHSPHHFAPPPHGSHPQQLHQQHPGYGMGGPMGGMGGQQQMMGGGGVHPHHPPSATTPSGYGGHPHHPGLHQQPPPQQHSAPLHQQHGGYLSQQQQHMLMMGGPTNTTPSSNHQQPQAPQQQSMMAGGGSAGPGMNGASSASNEGGPTADDVHILKQFLKQDGTDLEHELQKMEEELMGIYEAPNPSLGQQPPVGNGASGPTETTSTAVDSSNAGPMGLQSASMNAMPNRPPMSRQQQMMMAGGQQPTSATSSSMSQPQPSSMMNGSMSSYAASMDGMGSSVHGGYGPSSGRSMQPQPGSNWSSIDHQGGPTTTSTASASSVGGTPSSSATPTSTSSTSSSSSSLASSNGGGASNPPTATSTTSSSSSTSATTPTSAPAPSGAPTPTSSTSSPSGAANGQGGDAAEGLDVGAGLRFQRNPPGSKDEDDHDLSSAFGMSGAGPSGEMMGAGGAGGKASGGPSAAGGQSQLSSMPSPSAQAGAQQGGPGSNGQGQQVPSATFLQQQHYQQQQQLHQQQQQQQQQLQQHQQHQQQMHPPNMQQQLMQQHQQQQMQLQQHHHQQQQHLHQQQQQQLLHMQRQSRTSTAPSPPGPSAMAGASHLQQPTAPQTMGGANGSAGPKWKPVSGVGAAPGPGMNGGGMPPSGPASGPVPGVVGRVGEGQAPSITRSASYDMATQMKTTRSGLDARMGPTAAQGQGPSGLMQRPPYHPYGAYGGQGQPPPLPPHIQSQPPQPSYGSMSQPMQQPPQHGAMPQGPGGQPGFFQRNPMRTLSAPHLPSSAGQPPSQPVYGGQYPPQGNVPPQGGFYEGGSPAAGYPSGFYGRNGEMVARNGEGPGTMVGGPGAALPQQLQGRAQMRRLNQALGQGMSPSTTTVPSPGQVPGAGGASGAAGTQALPANQNPPEAQATGLGPAATGASAISAPPMGAPGQGPQPGLGAMGAATGLPSSGPSNYPIGAPGMQNKRPAYGASAAIPGMNGPGPLGTGTAQPLSQPIQTIGGPQGAPENAGPMVSIPQSLPRSDVALSQFKEVWDNLNMYRSYLFQLVPVNPNALLESNIKYILATPEGASIRTPLSLSVYVVMALGSLLRANWRMTREFANKAHEHLVHTLEQRQSIDYTLGQALLGMAYIEAAMETVPSSSKWKQFYAELAMKICKRLGAYSSILYFHSMFFISCDPTISLERLIQMQREGNQTPDLPYHTYIEPGSEGIRHAMPVSVLSHGRGNAAGRVLINVINGLNIHMKSSQLEHSQHLAQQQQGGPAPGASAYNFSGMGGTPLHTAPSPMQPGSPRAVPTSPAPVPTPSPLTKPMSPAPTSAHFGSWTASAPTSAGGPPPPAPGMPAGGPMGGPVMAGGQGMMMGPGGQPTSAGAMPPYFDSTSYFHQLMESMDKLENELRVIQTTSDPLPTYAYFTFCLCIYSLHAACCWRMGMKDKALYWANRFLTDSHKEEWRSCCGGPPMQEMIGLVLNIFLQMNELESLEFQLNQIERLLVVYPALSAMVTHFQKVLSEKKEQQMLTLQKRRIYGMQMPNGPMSPHPLASPPPVPMHVAHAHPQHMQPPMMPPHHPAQVPPSHMAQMSPHQTQMSPQQPLVAPPQMTPPQMPAQAQEPTPAPGEMSPPGAKGKGRGGARGGRAGRGGAAGATKRGGASVSTPTNDSTSTTTTSQPNPSPSAPGTSSQSPTSTTSSTTAAANRGRAAVSKAVRAKQPRNKKRERTQMEDEAEDGKAKDEQLDERERKREREGEATDLNAQPPPPPSLSQSQDEEVLQADLAMVNMNIPGMENVAPANGPMDNGMGINPDDLVLPFPPTLDDLQDPFTSLETEFNSWWENEGI